VLDHSDRATPVVPHQLVEVGDMHQWDVGAVGQRMLRKRCVFAWGAVFDVHGGNIDAGSTAQPLPNQLQLIRALQHHDIDLFVHQIGGCHFTRVIGPLLPCSTQRPFGFGRICR